MRGNVSSVVVALFHGASSGVSAGSLLVPRMELGDTSNLRRRTGTYVTILVFGSRRPTHIRCDQPRDGIHPVGIHAGTYSVSEVGGTPGVLFLYVLGSSVMAEVVLLVLSRYYVL